MKPRMAVLKKIIGMLSLTALLSGSLLAQHGGAPHAQLPCGTAHMVNLSLAQNPQLRTQMDALEQHTQRTMKDWEHRHPGQKSLFDSVLIIPVVVHVIFDNNATNISRAQVLDAMRIMNEDFSLTSRDTNRISNIFRPRAGVGKVIFRLATKDPQGNCTDGITRTFSSLTRTANDNVKNLISWPTDMYFNIWVVNSISFGAGGYAYYPGTAPRPEFEGVVVLASQFGSIGASGGSNFAARTMTHEVGHYLNLPHTWGSTNQPGEAANCGIDDGVQDTPNTPGVVGQGCPLTMASCAGDPTPVANVENYMDYSNCGRMFTQGQCTRMRVATLSSIGGRANLWSASNLFATGTGNPYLPPLCPPTAFFDRTPRMSCSGLAVAFGGQVFNTVEDTTLTYTWVSPTAMPDTLMGKVVSFVYPTPGTKTVTLITTNRTGADTLIATNIVEVKDATLGIQAPAQQSFESSTFPAVGPLPENNWTLKQDANANWTGTSSAATDGASAMQIDLRSASGGDTYAIISPRVSLAGVVGTPQLSFDYAYAGTVDTTRATLRVMLSSDCGGTWTSIASRSRGSVPSLFTASADSITGAYVPNRANWRTASINLNAWRAREFNIKFEMVADRSNAFWIDNVVIGTRVTSLEDALNADGITAWPNPVQDLFSAKWAGEHITKVQIQNAKGQLVCTHQVNQEAEQINLSTQTLPNGIYWFSLESRTGKKAIKKVAILH